MTDKADDVKVQLFALVPSEMFVGRAWLSETAKDALHLINTQAAEIAALREQLKQTQLGGALRDDYNEKRLNATIASQAAEIAALREREIMRLAGISTAAQGYFKDGESIHPDYDTVALRDVTALYRKYESQARSLEQLAVLRGRDESLVNQ